MKKIFKIANNALGASGIVLAVVACIVAGICFFTNPKTTDISEDNTYAGNDITSAENEEHESDATHLTEQTENKFEIMSGDELLNYLASLPDEPEALSGEGCFVISNKGNCYGMNFFSEFLNSYDASVPATITIGKYTTEGDLVLCYVAYDGEKVTLTRDSRRDKYAGNGNLISTDSCQFFSVMELPGTDGNIMIMHNDPEMTPEKVERILASSAMEGKENNGFCWVGSYSSGASDEAEQKMEQAADFGTGDNTEFWSLLGLEVDLGIVYPQINQKQDSKNADGTPSRAYVEALQEKISADMMAGKLPFVGSSSIRENPLRLEVALTEMTEENIATVYSYETNGSAITLRQSSGVIQDLQ